MVSSEYIEDVRSFEDLNEYIIITRKKKEKSGISIEGSGSHGDGSGEKSMEGTEISDMDSSFSENSEGVESEADTDFIETNDDDEGRMS